MKTAILLTMGAAITLTICGCSNQERIEESADQLAKEVAQGASETKDKAVTAMADAGDKISDAKEAFVKSAESRLAALDKKLAEHGAILAALDDAAKEEAQKAEQALKAKREALAKQLAEAKASTSDAWSELAEAFQKAAAELDQGIDDAGKALKQ